MHFLFIEMRSSILIVRVEGVQASSLVLLGHSHSSALQARSLHWKSCIFSHTFCVWTLLKKSLVWLFALLHTQLVACESLGRPCLLWSLKVLAWLSLSRRENHETFRAWLETWSYRRPSLVKMALFVRLISDIVNRLCLVIKRIGVCSLVVARASTSL